MADELRMGHLRGIVMRAPGMAETAEFYTESWGLHVAHREDGIVYLRGTGPEPFIYGLKDDDTYGIEYIHFGQPEPLATEPWRFTLLAATVLHSPDEVTVRGEGYRLIH